MSRRDPLLADHLHTALGSAVKLAGLCEKGRVAWDNQASWPIAMREYDGKRVVVEIEVQRSRRSDKANRRYWGCLVPLAQYELSQTRDLPLSKDQTHYVLVAAFAGCDITPLGPVPVRTKTMDTARFSTFCERVQAWLADRGLHVPEHGDGYEE